MKVVHALTFFVAATSISSGVVYGRRLGDKTTTSRDLLSSKTNKQDEERKLFLTDLLSSFGIGGLGGDDGSDGMGDVMGGGGGEGGGLDSLLDSLGIDLGNLGGLLDNINGTTTTINFDDISSFTDLFGGENLNGAFSILDNLGMGSFLSFNFTDIYDRCCGADTSDCNCPVRNNGTYAEKWDKSCDTILAFKAGVKEMPENYLSDLFGDFMADLTSSTPNGFFSGMLGDFMSGIMTDLPDLGSLGDILGQFGGDGGDGGSVGGSGSGPLGDILGQLTGGSGGGSLGDILGQLTGGGITGDAITGDGAPSELDGGGSAPVKIPDLGMMGPFGGSMEDFDLVQMYEQMFGKKFEYDTIAANCCKTSRPGFPTKFDMDPAACSCPMRKTMADVWEEQCKTVIIPGTSDGAPEE